MTAGPSPDRDRAAARRSRPRALLAFAPLLGLLAAGPSAEGSGLTVPKALAALLLLGWYPGWILLRLLAGPAAPGDLFRTLGGPLALSPIVSTGLIVLADLAGLDFETAAWVPVIVSIPLLLLVALRLRPAGGLSGDASTGTGGAGGARFDPAELRFLLGIIVATVAVIFLMNLANPWLRWRADGRFHIGVTAEILRGGLPPNDPFFSGLSLQYMWFFHAWLAGLKSLSGAATPWLLVATNLLGLAAFMALAAGLARGLGRGRGGVVLTLLVVAFGMGGLSWVWVGAKILGAFTGAEQGLPALRRLFDLWPPTIQASMGFLSAGYDQPFLLRKFLVGTAMSLALAALLLHLELCRRRLFGGSSRLLPLIALSAGGAIILHPMVGIPAVAVGIAAALLLPFLRPLVGAAAAGRPAAPTWPAIVSIVGAGLAGVVLALPYLLLVTGGKEAGSGALPIDLYLRKILALLAGSIGVSIPVVLALRRPSRWIGGSWPEAWIVLWGLLMVGFALVVRFPLERENIDKPTLLVHLGLALAAGGALGMSWEAGSRATRRRITTWMALLIVPVHAILLPTYLLEKDPRTYRQFEKEAQRFIAENAPADAIVFDSQDRDRPGVEIPRRMLWSHEQFAITHQYPKAEIDRRRALRDALFGPTGPDPAALFELKAIGAPVYVMLRAGAVERGRGTPSAGGGEPAGTGPTDGSFGDGDFDPLARHPAFERVFDRDDVRVYRLR